MYVKGACPARSRAQEWQLGGGHRGPCCPGDAPPQRTNKAPKFMGSDQRRHACAFHHGFGFTWEPKLLILILWILSFLPFFFLEEMLKHPLLNIILFGIKPYV